MAREPSEVEIQQVKLCLAEAENDLHARLAALTQLASLDQSDFRWSWAAHLRDLRSEMGLSHLDTTAEQPERSQPTVDTERPALRLDGSRRRAVSTVTET